MALVTLQKINESIAKYAVDSIAPRLENKMSQFLIGASAAVGAFSVEKMVNPDVLKQSGLMTADGLIDTKLARMALEGGFNASGSIPIANIVKIDKSDAEAILAMLES